MIMILMVYLTIGIAELRYLRREKRKKRTFVILIVSLTLLLLLSEVLYAVRTSFQISVWIEALFGPIDSWLIGG